MNRKEYLKNYQRLWIAKRRKDWFDKNGPCKDCGSTEKLELHHIDHSTKVSHRIWSFSYKRIAEETAKCKVLCKVCHQIYSRPIQVELGKKLSDINRKFSKESINIAVELRKQGNTCREIARKLNVAHSQVVRQTNKIMAAVGTL